MKKLRNEVFNSKRVNLNINSVVLNNFTVKPIRADDGQFSQVCVTFDKTNANAISFYVNYRLKEDKVWLNSHTETTLNVINIKDLRPGLYQVRVVAVSARQQTPSAIKEVEIIEESVRPKKFNKEQKDIVSQTILTIANNLADDIIAEVYFMLSTPDSLNQILNRHPFYDDNDN